MKKELPLFTDRTQGTTEKRWYVQEAKRDIVLPVPLAIARERLTAALSSGTIKQKNYRPSSARCTGNIDGNFIDITLSLRAGRGQIEYQVLGELIACSDGCLVQVVIRDSNALFNFLSLAAFITFIYVREGFGFGLSATFFFGVFGCGATVLQHSFGIRSVSKVISDIITNDLTHTRFGVLKNRRLKTREGDTGFYPKAGICRFLLHYSYFTTILELKTTK